jgi:tetratricopeptide (TPR) repeat protein
LKSTQISLRVCIALVLITAWSCSPTRERKINRWWHTLTGHYNVYFNGEQKLLEATQALEAGHSNDFTRILDIFPYGDEAAAKGVTPQLDEVLKKTSKSIQEHTVGNYTDDSYALMGKAHFFKQDYFAAIESFQYVNSRYKDKGLKPIATTWIAKSYMGLKKPDEAEAIISNNISEFGPKMSKGKPVKLTLKERIFKPYPKEYNKELYTTAADIAIKQKKYSTAAQLLSKALEYTTRKNEKIRYSYILGQLYLQIDSISLANKYFTKVLGMNAPYEFEFNASINVARAYDPRNKYAVKKVRRSLKRMLKDDKNDGLYDQIHYELAKLEYKQNNIAEALKQYKLSVAKSTTNKNQKGLSYLALGNVYLNMPNYRLAQAYYDSTAGVLSKDYKDYAAIMLKKDLLSELISHLVVIETEDSLQRIAKLSTEQIEKKIDTWIIAQKLDRERKETEEKMRKEQEKNAGQSGVPALAQGVDGGSGQWYFYNRNTVITGQAEFFSMKKWGKRKNEDFWRLSQKPKEVNMDDVVVTPDGKIEAGNPAFAIEEDDKSSISKDTAAARIELRKEWIKDVPFTESALQKSNARIQSAFFEIGILYDEKLLDYKEAILSFEILMDRFPKSNVEPEVMYRLHKLYLNVNDAAKSAYYRAQLIAKYPESAFALILQNKTIASAETDNNTEVVSAYEKMYAAFQAENYNSVLQQYLDVQKQFPGNALRAKFDLLNTLAIGKTKSLQEFESELNLLIKDYPDTDIAQYAQSVISLINKKEEPVSEQPKKPLRGSEFTFDEDAKYYYVFAVKNDKGEKFDNNEALMVFNRYNEEFESTENYRVNSILTNDGYQVIYITQITGLNKSMKYLKDVEMMDIIKQQLKYKGEYLQFVITVASFKKMLREQKTDTYYETFVDFREDWKNKPLR